MDGQTDITKLIVDFLNFVDAPKRGTALLVGRPRDRFPVVSLGIFFFRSYRRNHEPWGRISL